MRFRNNETDFWNWCKHYLRQAKSVIRAYDNIESSSYRFKNIKAYKEAKEILEQYEVLKFLTNGRTKSIIREVIDQ
ncbi:hypothetical protein HF295_00430 [Hujiaoplasma nucleasis]|uniref:Uncharacterized protein n=1 Tax=Hujiaoplasma nucleasis TaxID=2725268 RepID=A0A7L6N4H4_9MOLU|nr:hypothetical protein [Hujiaoplasma nucleasis]QLY39404.1 hypothetical protein HF295_00430 [Hujiaoplasma nucleasis]